MLWRGGYFSVSWILMRCVGVSGLLFLLFVYKEVCDDADSQRGGEDEEGSEFWCRGSGRSWRWWGDELARRYTVL